MRKTLIISILGIVLFPIIASSAPNSDKKPTLTNESMNIGCTRDLASAAGGKASDGYCMMWFEGAAFGYALGQSQLACAPKDFDMAMLLSAYQRWIARNPIELEKDFHGGVFSALLEAFPCHKTVK